MLSGVIPVLNEEVCLPACLASLMCQETTGPFEVIVADNGSTDRSASIARAWGARVVVSPERGVVYARQAGLEAAEGDVVVQMDADSRLAPGAFRAIEEAFADPRVVAVLGHVVYRPGTWLTKALEAAYWAINALAMRLLGRPVLVLAGALSVRLAILVAAGGYETGLPDSGDEYGILERLAAHGRVLWLPAIVVESSDRRFRGRALRFLLVDFLMHTLIDRLVYRFARRSRFGHRVDVR